ncbi:MAG: hypothetical protein PHH11_10380 [Methylomonas sp.]|nr:hypothetical protein [Methylomonas sp.]
MAKYNFFEHPELFKEDKTMAARAGAWYWRFERSPIGSTKWELNSRAADVNNFIRSLEKINWYEAHPEKAKPDKQVQYQRQQEQRLQGSQRITTAIDAGNAYGNMGEMLQVLGITTTNSKGYQSQFGVTLAQRKLIAI